MKDSVFFKFNNFHWEGIEKIDYKPTAKDAQITFRDTSRQNLVEDGQNTKFHIRYFECAVGGFSSLEKHEHVHVVIVVRGNGKVIVSDKIYDAKPMDMIVIPPGEPHQLINISQEEPFGFFCTVDAERDKFITLTRMEIEALKENEEVAKYIQVSAEYHLEGE